VTFDQVDLDSVDVVCDLDRGIPLPDGSVDEIHSCHFLEHVADLRFVLGEMIRVLKPGGTIHCAVPHFSNPHFYSDPTHRLFFGLYTFSYFDKAQSRFKRRVPSFYTDLDIRLTDARLVFDSTSRTVRRIKRVIERVINLRPRGQEIWEENFCWMFPANEIRYTLAKPRPSPPAP
jgi:SAM-dependent methyltransferase